MLSANRVRRVNRWPSPRVVSRMSAFASVAPPYNMPATSRGDTLLNDTAEARSRALNQFLASVELKAYKIAQAGLRHQDDALDAVQDAMLQLARAYADRPAEEWKPLFYRILENRIRDMQRRRTVRGRVMAWLPFRRDEDDEDADPIAQAPEPGSAAGRAPGARRGDDRPGCGARRSCRTGSARRSCCATSRAWTSRRRRRPWVAPRAASRHTIFARCRRCA